MQLNKFQEGCLLSGHDCEIKVDFSPQESSPNPKKFPEPLHFLSLTISSSKGYI